MNEQITVVCGADENYAIPMAVTLYSALANLENSRTCDIYVLDGGVRPASKERLKRVISTTPATTELHWMSIDETKIQHLPTRDWISAAAYSRLLIPELLPNEKKKAIYLDSDLQVESSLSDLWTMDFDGCAVMATQAYGTPYVSSKRGLTDYVELGIPAEAPYFNSGVLVLNLEKWRQNGISQSVIDYRLANNEDHTVDQGALNAVLSDDWKQLDLKWNVMSHLVNFEEWPESSFKEKVRKRRDELMQEPNIYHFAGGSKPWQIGCNHPAQLQWIGYLWESGWFTAAERAQWFGKWFLRYYWWHVKKRLGVIG